MLAAENLEGFTQLELIHLRNCSPLKHFDDKTFATFLVDCVVSTVRQGETLFSDTEPSQWIYFLLSGEVEVFDHERQSFIICGGTVEAMYPLTAHAEARVKAVACSVVRCARLGLDQLQHIESQVNAFNVQEISDEEGDLDQRILVDVFHALQDEELVLPSLPEVAIKIRSAAANDDVSVDNIASIVRTDPATSAYCVGIANSAAYHGEREIGEIREAVVRMGIEATRDSVTAYTLRSLYHTDNAIAEQVLRTAWAHSCRIAATSFVLAKKMGNLNPERAMLAGLLHEIGTTVLITTCIKLEGGLSFGNGFSLVARELAGPIGAMVLRSWHFPESFINVALEPENYRRQTDEKPTLQDIVVLAHYHDNKPTPWSEPTVNPDAFDAYKFLGSDAFNDNHRLHIIDEASEELEGVMKFLNA